MNKKYYYGLFAAGMLFATSCSNDELTQVQSGEYAEVSISLGVEEVAGSRAISDGKGANELHYAVFDEQGQRIEGIAPVQDKVVTFPTTETLTLAKGQTYKVAFWAQNKDCQAYTVSPDMNVTVDYDGINNDETRDAFFKTVEFTVNGSTALDVELTRPFAQINVGVDAADWNAAVASGVEIKESNVTIKQAAKAINLVTGKVSTPVDVEYTTAAIPNEPLKANNGTYNWLSMSYILVFDGEESANGAQDATLTSLAYTFIPKSGKPIAFKDGLNNVPVKRNWRTNILGKILTGDITFNISIDPIYEGDKNYPDGSMEQQLEMAATFGGTVTLTSNVELKAPLTVGADMVLDLNGFNISTELEEEGRHHYAILNNATMILKGANGSIKARGIKNFGTMTIDGDITITNLDTNGGAAVWNEGTLTINGGTFTTNENPGDGSYGAALNTRSGGIAIVNGGNFTAYSQLTYAIVNEGTTTINDAMVKGKHGAVSGSNTNTTVINGGTFELMENPGVSDHCTYYCSEIRGGKFTLGKNTDSGAQVFYESNIAAGFKSIEKNGTWYVVANDVTVAATSAEVKTVFGNGGSVILAEDIAFEGITSIEPGAEVYLNLNGKTITVDENTASNTLMYVKEGAKLTIDGNGIIDLGEVSTMAIFAPYGELVIENGTFIRDKVTTVTNKTTGLFMGCKVTSSNVTINGGYFDPGYYDTNAADIEELLAGTVTFEETADDIAKRGNSKDANKVRVALKDNVSVVLNHSGYGSFKIYGGTFVGANPAWGDEGCMLPTTPNYLRPWSYYQGALLDGQTFNENGIVLPDGYAITKGTTKDGIPTYTVTYNK